jgi:hypothetical protein
VHISGTDLSFRFRPSNQIDMMFVGARRRSAPEGVQLAGRVNYLPERDPRSWQTNIPVYSSVQVPELYRGIKAVYRGAVSGIESDFWVSPGADPRLIRMRFGGAQRVSIQENGGLVISGSAGEVRQSKPVAYQEVAGSRRAVDAAYVWRDGSIGFQTGPYDVRLPLVIDPVVVAYVGIFGGSAGDEGDAIAVDSSGAAYIAGYTESYNFPITPGAADSAYNLAGSSFVTKLTPGQNGIIYSTYLGGYARGIAVDKLGSAYVIGSIGFTGGAQVTKLSSAGDAILYQVSLPGPGQGLGVDIGRQFSSDGRRDSNHRAGGGCIRGQTGFGWQGGLCHISRR